MYRIKKTFEGYPFAHRQPTHDGHCKLIHGHNWSFEICVEADQLDENGFVYDFGKFGWLKNWLADKFDHTCLINKDDPQLGTFQLLQEQGLLDLVVVESCSSEGLAKMVYERIENVLNNDGNSKSRGLQLTYVVVHEDETNSAQYTGSL